jgi:hypothetical protein
VFVALAVVVVATLALGTGTTGAAFSPYNPAWDGTAEFRATVADAGAELLLAERTTRYDGTEPNRTVAVVLSPDRAYGPTDRARVRSFVRRGGTLVVAEDFGPHGNALLAGVGAEARVTDGLVRDERFNYRSPAVPRATNVTSHPLTGDVERLTLNYATTVEPNGARPLVRTSEFAYVDRDRDGRLDDSEALASRPVVTVEPVGEGRVVTVSDPSVFLNAMLTQDANRQFVRDLTDGSGTVLFDDSHADRLPTRMQAVLALRRVPGVSALVGAGAVLAVFALVERPPWLRRGRSADDPTPPVDVDALVETVGRRHPDWDAGRLRRVAEGLISHTPETDDDE